MYSYPLRAKFRPLKFIKKSGQLLLFLSLSAPKWHHYWHEHHKWQSAASFNTWLIPISAGWHHPSRRTTPSTTTNGLRCSDSIPAPPRSAMVGELPKGTGCIRHPQTTGQKFCSSVRISNRCILGIFTIHFWNSRSHSGTFLLTPYQRPSIQCFQYLLSSTTL